MGLLSRMFGRKGREPHPVHPDDALLVTDEDRRWFSGLSNADLAALDQEDSTFQFATFLKLRNEDGLRSDAAARKCWKAFPYYYSDPSTRGANPLGFNGVDAELPFLIKDRVNRLAMTGRLTSELADQHMTMNAAIRQLLVRGTTGS